MTTTNDNSNQWNDSDYWRSVIADLDGSYEEYKNWREILWSDDYEKAFEKRSRCYNITQYLQNFDDVVDWIDYLHEKALEIEDYEFCAVLLRRRLWSHWKNTEINKQYENV